MMITSEMIMRIPSHKITNVKERKAVLMYKTATNKAEKQAAWKLFMGAIIPKRTKG